MSANDSGSSSNSFVLYNVIVNKLSIF